MASSVPNSVMEAVRTSPIANLPGLRSTGLARDHRERAHPESILEAQDIDAGYGPIQILFGSSMHVRPGERVALLGTNGAGKSTLLRVVSGLMKPTSGAIWFDGHRVDGSSPQHLVDLGVVYISGGRATFPSLTVLENLKMSAYPVRRNRAEVNERVEEALHLFPRLAERATQKAGTLSGGEQQMVAVGRALVARPRLLMIDELSLGLAPIMLLQLEEMVKVLAQKGMTMLIIEQSLNMAAKIAERAYFMEKGQVRFEGNLTELMQRDDLVRSVFFGSERTDSTEITDTNNSNGKTAKVARAAKPAAKSRPATARPRQPKEATKQ